MKLKEWLRLRYSMTMPEFLGLSPEKQEEIRTEQLQVNREEQQGYSSAEWLRDSYGILMTAEQEEAYDEKMNNNPRHLEMVNRWEVENAYAILRECGVPFDEDGEPVGIWDDD